MPLTRPLFLLALLGILTVTVWRPAAEAHKEQNMHLSDQDKKQLHEIARESIATGLQSKPMPPLQDMAGVLAEPRGAFVTLHLRGGLRGCIGFIEAVKPLAATIQEMARAAAFGDPRFPPLTAREFKDVDIEISVLSPLRRIKDVAEIQVGAHGLYLMNGSRRGLLLPQVATQYNWDRDTFLQHTCQKAGLPAMAWKDPQTEIYIFSAEIF